MSNHCYGCKSCIMIEEENGFIHPVCLDKNNRDIMQHKWTIKDFFKKENYFPQNKEIARLCIEQYLKYHDMPEWCTKPSFENNV